MTRFLWTGYNYTESEQFCGEPITQGLYVQASRERGNGWSGIYSNSAKIVHTSDGDVTCQPGDWIVRDDTGMHVEEIL